MKLVPYPMYRNHRIILLAGTGMLALAQPAMAQDAPAEETATSGDAIVVTARKREERLQDVPLAIAAFSGQELKERNIRSLADLAASTPGLSFQDVNGAYAAPVLRGVAQIDQTGPQGNVGVFIDGVYLNNRSALSFDQYDLGRIEVVKGPQSALYGRNTFAGAINYVTNGPDFDRVGASAQATIGNYGRYEGKASVNVPVGDRVAVRVFGGYSKFDGTILNNRSKRYLDGWDNRWSAGANIKAKLTDSLTLQLFGVHSATTNDQPALYSMPTTLNNCGSTAASGLKTFFCGTLPVPTTYDLDDTVGFGLKGFNNIYYGKLAYEGEMMDITALVSHTNARFAVQVDTTGNAAAVNIPFISGLSRQLFTNAATTDSHDWNYELRFASKSDGPLSWMFGVNHYSSLVADVLSLNFQKLGVTTAQPPVFSSRGGILMTKGHALYGSLGYQLTSTIDVQAELRYTIDDQNFLGTGSSAGVRGGQTFRYATPRFAINWKPGADVLLYATAARGLKTGGFNSNAAGTAYFSFGPETNWTYEAGVKTTLMGGLVTANANAFYIDWRHIQAQTQLPFSTLAVVDNNGDAHVKGVEAQITINPSRNLSFSANGALLDPKYRNGVVDGEVSFICGEILGSTVKQKSCTSAVDGNQIARTSNKQFALSGNWTIPDIASGVDGYVRADYSWQSAKYSTSLTGQNQGVISLANLRAGLKWGGYELSIWSKNLFDRKYVSRATVVASTADGAPISGVSYTRIYPGERRTWGVDISARF